MCGYLPLNKFCFQKSMFIHEYYIFINDKKPVLCNQIYLFSSKLARGFVVVVRMQGIFPQQLFLNYNYFFFFGTEIHRAFFSYNASICVDCNTINSSKKYSLTAIWGATFFGTYFWYICYFSHLCHFLSKMFKSR